MKKSPKNIYVNKQKLFLKVIGSELIGNKFLKNTKRTIRIWSIN